MSLLAELKNLPEELSSQVKAVYTDHFPWEVRVIMADWIELQPWGTIEYNNPEHEEFAANLISNLILQINLSAQSIENLSLKYRLEQSVQHIQNHFASNPINLVRIINHCLSNDAKILQTSRRVSEIIF